MGSPFKSSTKRGRLLWVLASVCISLAVSRPAAAANTFANIIEQVQPKIVKIYGAGGLQGLEPYQTGFLISGEGHVLTVWSYVLDADYITVTLNDGRKFQGTLLGADPRLEIAVLKIEATELPHFNLAEAPVADPGARVLAFSNLYGVAAGNEPASVQHGVVSAKAALAARKGAFETPYKGTAYVLDAMTNNPGAAGGALTDRQGRLLGLVGKELRNSLNNTWLNFALPAAELTAAIDDIKAGKIRPRATDEAVKRPAKAVSLATLGLVLVPDVLPKTPPFVDRVLPSSAAAKAGLKPDDLVLFVNNRVAPSCKTLVDELGFIPLGDEVRLTIQRGQELLEIALPTAE